MPDYEKLYQERRTRVETAVENRQPDRVPNCMNCGAFPYREYGVTMAESINDFEKAAEAVLRFYTEFTATDTASGGAHMRPAKVLEALGSKTARWPGDPKGLDVNNTYQFIEFPTLLEDEYDEFFNDPAGFSVRKLLPRQYEVFEPMSEIDYFGVAAGGGIQAFMSPRMIDSYKRLIFAAEESERMRTVFGECNKKLRSLGYYSMSGGSSATAFDMLADTLRGTFGMMPDLIEQRENVKRALDIFADIHVKNSLAASKAMGSRYAWVMLHKGFDNFISERDYAELYWKYLRKWIVALVDEGITPVVYTEGSYTTRLKFLAEVPKNKVVYHFEKVDLKEAKRVLGDVASIMGGFPVTTLQFGTKEEIVDKVKETLDALAPGGGYLFSTSSSMDHCPRENLETLFEAVEKYGKY